MKTKINTVIIDDNIVMKSLIEHFNQNERVNIIASYHDGKSALDYILDNKYNIDLIIIDMLLPKLEGAALLKILKEKNISIRTIVTSMYKDESVIHDIAKYNVSHYLIKPYNISALEERIYEIFEDPNKPEGLSEKQRLDLEISNLLHNLGIPSHIRGYKYIRDGVTMIYNNDKLSLVTKEIYPQIAIKYETTPSRVERAIRHAIEVSWIRGDLALMEDLFGFSVSCEKSKPTNSEFLSTLADRFKVDKKFCKQ